MTSWADEMDAFDDETTPVVRPPPLPPKPRILPSHTGRVCWYDPIRGFGFAMIDGLGRDVFLHKSVLTDATYSPAPGDRIACMVERDPHARRPNKLRAVGVRHHQDPAGKAGGTPVRR
jgi:cold shock CspA family protein